MAILLHMKTISSQVVSALCVWALIMSMMTVAAPGHRESAIGSWSYARLLTGCPPIIPPQWCP